MRQRNILLLIGLILLAGVVSADTVIIYTAGASDGDAYHTNQNDVFSTVRNALGVTVTTNAQSVYHATIASTTSNQFKAIYRPMFYFNTSVIGSGKTVTSATLTVYSVSELHGLGYAYYGVTGVTPITPGTVSLGDYSNFSDTVYSNTINGSAFAVSSDFQNFTFNSAGLSAVNPTGWSTFMIRNYWDISNSFNGTWASGATSQVRISTSEASGKVPFMTITFETSGADTTPPQSLSGFANITTCSGTNISFSKPADTDYNGFMAWWNNVADTNQTNATMWYNKSGLTESTTYTLSTKTFDLTGNVNASFQNYSIRTGACGIAPVAQFSANNLTVCEGTNTQFTDASTNTPTSWYWDFGDSNTSTEQNPLKTYDVIGLMTVNLTATNAYGSDSEVKTDYINVTTCAEPTPTLTTVPTTAPPALAGCKYTNLTGVTLVNSTEWTITMGNISWGTYQNVTEGNVSIWSCIGTPTPTPTQPPWAPDINPSTEGNFRLDSLISFWWIPALLLLIYVLFRRT